MTEKHNNLPSKPEFGPHHKMVQQELFPITEKQVDGIEMGVLNNGVPYLTMRGLARICGVDHKVIQKLASNWEDEKNKPRGRKILELLVSQGNGGASLFLATSIRGREVHAYTDAVCMAVLEYYAFESPYGGNETALRNYRILARYSIRQFIYNACGYSPDTQIPEAWRNYQERILQNDEIPVGYYSVFREIADFVVHIIRAGCPFDDHCVPDISVGQLWSRHWTASDMSKRFGDRRKHPHNYPDWYPQSQANPVDAWIYPVSSLGEYRIWLYEVYIPDKFPNYLAKKVKQDFLPASSAELIATTLSQKPRLESS